MSFVKHFLVFIIYSCDTSRCVQNESYLLRYRSQDASDNASELDWSRSIRASPTTMCIVPGRGELDPDPSTVSLSRYNY